MLGGRGGEERPQRRQSLISHQPLDGSSQTSVKVQDTQNGVEAERRSERDCTNEILGKKSVLQNKHWLHPGPPTSAQQTML